MFKIIALIFFILYAFIGEGHRFQEPDSSKYKRVRFSPLPVIYFTPETKFGIGALAALNFEMGGMNDSVTKSSYLQSSAIVTQNKQFEFNNLGRIFFFYNKSILQLNLYFAYFPINYFGVQNPTPWKQKELIEFNKILVELRYLKKTRLPHFYIGPFFRLHKIYNINAQTVGVLNSDAPLGYSGYTAMGLGPILNYDSRNNLVNPTKGSFADFNFVYNPGGIYNSTEFITFKTDIRTYKKLSKTKHRVLGAQFVSQWGFGAIPFKDLSEFGGPLIMRGYYQGYFRYPFMYAAQIEYRHTLWRFLGFATWVGAGATTSQWYEWKEENLHPNAGAGLRFRINKKDKLNIRLDYGIGQHQQGFYIDIAESF